MLDDTVATDGLAAEHGSHHIVLLDVGHGERNEGDHLGVLIEFGPIINIVDAEFLFDEGKVAVHLGDAGVGEGHVDDGVVVRIGRAVISDLGEGFLGFLIVVVGSFLGEVHDGLAEGGGVVFGEGDDFPELELSGALEEVLDTLFILHTGEFHHDTAGSILLDGGLGNTVAVHTLAEDLEG